MAKAPKSIGELPVADDVKLALSFFADQIDAIYRHLRADVVRSEIKQAIIAIEDLSAGGDISARPVFCHRQKVATTAIGILSQGTPAGVDDSNTSVIAVSDDGSNEIVSKTYNASVAFPTNDYEDLGSLSQYRILNAGEHLLLDVTNGTTANLPAFLLLIEYQLR